MNQSLIFGKDQTSRIVSLEVNKDGQVEIFRELEDGSVVSEFRQHQFWSLYSEKLNSKFKQLDGDQHFQWMVEYDSYEKWRETISMSYKKRYDFWTSHDVKTNFMLRSGTTYYKGMRIDEVSVLSFDIETTGLDPNAPDAQVLLISNTFRKNGKTVKKLFCVDDYTNDCEMITDWSDWVMDVNPSIVLGHYILGFDLPYLKARVGRLLLGRDTSPMVISDRVRQFRKDGSQSYDYQDICIYGRELIDTKFLAIKYDIKREFPSYSLKPIINHLKLEKADRAFVDASKMKEMYLNRKKDPTTWQRVKDYALDDSEDSLKLFDLMAPQFFYYAQSIPMSFQQINNTATGTQINNFMVRAYLQEGHSIPKADKIERFPGGLVFAQPGIHKNVLRFDVSSLYPSVMLQYGIGPGEDKDPKGYFILMLDHFTNERLANKAKGKTDKYIESLSGGQKIVINSAYGMLGADGLNFNNRDGADLVTDIGRQVLKVSAKHMSGKEVHGTIDFGSEEDDTAA